MATSITYPYITVKSRMHVAAKEGPQDNMIESVRRIVREEGWSGLYKGTWMLYAGLEILGESANWLCRYWTESYSERYHGGLPVCFQGRLV